MGKFDGILLVSDCDGTLLSKNNEISADDVCSIKHFMDEGGRFAFATGRIASELKVYNDLVRTNAPAICYNGAVIYDFETEKETVITCTGEDIVPFLESIENDNPEIMIDIISNNTIHYFRENDSLKKHKSISIGPFLEVEHYKKVPAPWLKIAAWGMPDDVKRLSVSARTDLLPEGYEFVHSYEYCCELLFPGASKGNALTELVKMLPDVKKVIAVGDNTNDILMLEKADLSFVPANAVQVAKDAADVVLESDCNNSPLTEVIDYLEKKI